MSKLAQACELSFNDWLTIFPDVIPEAERSKKHEKWKKKLFDKIRHDHYHILTTKTIKVMWIATIISMMLLTAFVIPSSRECILHNFDDFSRYKITQNNKNYVSGKIKVGYIPDEFELESTRQVEKSVLNKYVSKNGAFFTISKSPSEGEIDFDTENFASEEKIDGRQKYVYCKGNLDIDNLIWTKNDYVYRISGPFTLEQFIKIAKTVE